MNVFFDYQIFYLQKYGGISRYFVELNNQLNKISDCKAQIVAPYHQNEYLKDPNSQTNQFTLNSFLKKTFYNTILDKRIFVNEQAARFACHSNKPALLHETYYTHRFQVKAPKVITIHDMIYELFSSQSEEEKKIIANKKQAIVEADKIIAVSHSTKNDLLSLYPEVKDKVQVIHHGITPVHSEEVTAYSHNKPYILFVGNRDWYKNFEPLLEVYAQSKEIQADFDLVCFGGHSFTDKESEFIRLSNIAAKVKQINGDDALLNQLYKGASVLAYLSKYEGFGFPVLEAMNLNCPVICSNGSSLPEVAGEFASKIDVSDKHEIEQALTKVLFEASFDQSSQTNKKNWLGNFTWQKCASETYQVYKQLV